MQGLLTCFACDPVRRDWLVTGSAKGSVAIWDLRFQVEPKSTFVSCMRACMRCNECFVVTMALYMVDVPDE